MGRCGSDKPVHWSVGVRECGGGARDDYTPNTDTGA